MKLNGRVAIAGHQVRRVRGQSLRLKLASRDQCVWQDARGIVVQQFFRRHAVRRFHRRRGQRNNSRGTELRRKPQRDRPAHRVPGKNGAIRHDQSACRQSPQQRPSAVLRVLCRKRARRAPVPGKVRDVNGQPQFRKAPRQIPHDVLVRGKPMEKDHGARIGLCRRVTFLNNGHVRTARTRNRVHALFHVATRARIGPQHPHNQKGDPGQRLPDRFAAHAFSSPRQRHSQAA